MRSNAIERRLEARWRARSLRAARIARWSRVGLLAVLTGLAAVLLAGCESGGAVTANAACGIFRPITWAKLDTAPTVKQVREHNAAGVAVCGWRAP